MTFYFTFGFGHSLRDHYVTIEAENAEAARKKMVRHHGQMWAFQYDEKSFAGQPEKYGITEIPLGTSNYWR